MIVGDFDLVCVAVAPHEADPVLIVDPDAVLPCALTLKRLQAITGKKSKIGKHLGGMNLDQFSLNDLSEPMEASGILPVKNELRFF